jgi:four helix bundle protein
MQDYEKLDAWKMADELVLDVYRITAAFPSEERFGLAAHLRKTALSAPSNIAEGCGRYGSRELHNFLNIACGSNSELEYQLRLSHQLKYISDEEHESLRTKTLRLRKMLHSLMNSVRAAG